jgi:hypothetical protein
MPARNTLTAADPKYSRNGFRTRLSAIGDSPHHDRPSAGPPFSGTPDGLAAAEGRGRVRRCRKAGRRGIAVRSTPCRPRDLGTLGLVLREGAGGRPRVIGELDVSTARIGCPIQHRWRFTRGPLTSTVFTALHVLPEGELPMASVSGVSSASAGPRPIFRRKAQFPRRGLGGGFPDARPRSSGRAVLRDASNERSGRRPNCAHSAQGTHDAGRGQPSESGNESSVFLPAARSALEWRRWPRCAAA